MLGKQIRIYLSDGTSSSIRHAEITNWTGQALACSRSRFAELRHWAEVKRPGVYFLFGIEEESGEEIVYIGESEVVLDRLANHMTGKEFWSELVAFTSKDENLTKSHIKFLESRLIDISKKAGRYQISNSATPQLPSLPRADRDAMEEFLAYVHTLLGVLGHRVLDSLPGSNGASKPAVVTPTGSTSSVQNPEVQPPASTTFFLNTGGVRATAVKSDEGLVVLAGAHAASTVRASLSGGYRLLREKLVSTGALVDQGGFLHLERDQLFTSPSQAAAVLVGYAINGREAWKLSDGRSYADFDKISAEQLLSALDEQ